MEKYYIINGNTKLDCIFVTLNYAMQGEMMRMIRSTGNDEVAALELNKIKSNVQYFPNLLKSMMNKIPLYPVTIVEAASGYGKTTCIRHFFTSVSGADVRWISFSEDEMPED